MTDTPSNHRLTASYKQLPAHLHAPFEALKRQKAGIKHLLSTDAGQEAFLKDPVAAMEAAGIEIAPPLRKALLSGGGKIRNLKGASAAMFANGATVAPNVRIRITA